VRIWDIEPGRLCRQHLLGEQRELHAVWSIITAEKRGYAKHPEVLRWHGRLRALYLRHELLVTEMTRRGCRHATLLDEALATGEATQDVFVDSVEEQERLLREKGCECQV
jgi:Pyrimidine dimer DNA glycosylase